MNKPRLCNYDRDNELNNRINTRHFPSITLKPNFDPQPQSTKYTLNKKERTASSRGVADTLKNCDSSMVYKEFTTSNVFFPGDSRAPISHLIDNIDTETKLRNQNIVLVKKDINQYLPEVNSQLYNVYDGFMENDALTHKLLRYKTGGTNNNKCVLAPNTFHNITRTNVKNI